jgi:hypothetical protein
MAGSRKFVKDEVNGLMVAINAVPEPSSIVLMGIGGVVAAVAYRRRRPAAT